MSRSGNAFWEKEMFFIDTDVAICLENGRAQTLPVLVKNNIDLSKGQVCISDLSLFELSRRGKLSMIEQLYGLSSFVGELSLSSIDGKVLKTAELSFANPISNDFRLNDAINDNIALFLANEIQATIVSMVILNLQLAFSSLQNNGKPFSKYYDSIDKSSEMTSVLMGFIKAEIRDKIKQESMANCFLNEIFMKAYYSAMASFYSECYSPFVSTHNGYEGCFAELSEESFSEWHGQYLQDLKKNAFMGLPLPTSGDLAKINILKTGCSGEPGKLPKNYKMSMQEPFVHLRKRTNKKHDFLMAFDRRLYEELFNDRFLKENDFVDQYNLWDFCYGKDNSSVYISGDKDQIQWYLMPSEEDVFKTSIPFYKEAGYSCDRKYYFVRNYSGKQN